MMYCLTAPLINAHGLVLTTVTHPQIEIRQRLTIRRIREAVASYYDVPLHALVSDRRSREVARPRQIAMYLAKELTPKSLPCIGREFNRDHTTVIHAVRQINKLRLVDGEIADDIDALRMRLAA